jgi:predicted Rossmann fold flavoprotein
MKSVCIIGGGPAGMMAAYTAAVSGHRVRLFEKNEKLGKKLYITGKGRCNLTNAAPIADFFDCIISNPSFLYSAFYTLDNVQLMDWFAQRGMPTKTERGGRVFPVSDKSSDVIRTLEKALVEVGVEISLRSEVQRLCIEDGRCVGVICGGETMLFDRVVVATGGVSYASTGSTGDGYMFAQAAGHKLTAPHRGIRSAGAVGKRPYA